MRRARTSERGAALLIVMVAVAVLTVLAADLAYEARVSLQIAANARNEVQASYLAKSGVALSRLVLQFQREVDDTLGAVGGAGGAGGMGIPRPILWKIAPVSSELADAIFAGSFRTAPETAAAAPASLASGTFQAEIDDEGRKVNFQLDATGGTGPVFPAQIQALWQLVCDPRWDPLFDREDATGQRVTRLDLLVYLRDWVDSEDPATSSALTPGFAAQGCVVAVPQKPFESGFGDENALYSRLDEPYYVKNARIDSLDELHLVGGIGDAFMAAFGDRITVYLAPEEKRQINGLDPLDILANAQGMASASDDPKLRDLAFLQELQKALFLLTFGGRTSISPAQFGEVARGLGLDVDSNKAGPNGPFTDRSTVFRLRSTGRVGDVSKTLDVIVRVDKPQGVVVTPGKILHWREE